MAGPRVGGAALKFMALDIEAVVDGGLWTPEPPVPQEIRVDLPDSENAITAKLWPPAKDQFAPPNAWRPICIGAVLFSVEGDQFRVLRVGVIDEPKDQEPDVWERKILERFAATVEGQQPDLITWNGRRYDMPVLASRSMRHGIPWPWWFINHDVRHRYSERGHCDLADQLADHGAAPAMKMDSVAKLIGLPGKFGDIDGAGVAAAFEAGRHQEIAAYCLADAVQTALIFLRWKLFQGRWSLAEYQAAAGQILEAVDATPVLPGFSARVDKRLLLLTDRGETAAAPEAA